MNLSKTLKMLAISAGLTMTVASNAYAEIKGDVFNQSATTISTQASDMPKSIDANSYSGPFTYRYSDFKRVIYTNKNGTSGCVFEMTADDGSGGARINAYGVNGSENCQAIYTADHTTLVVYFQVFGHPSK